jgi:hypothetical protein
MSRQPQRSPSQGEASTAPPREMRPSYAQRACELYGALCCYFAFVHQDFGATSELTKKGQREVLAKKAGELGRDVVRAQLACRGTDRKCGYDHDIIYGVPKLFKVLGKPQLAATCTEGSEHAHQEFKAFFKRMCSHSSKKMCDMLQFMNLHALKRHVCTEHRDLLPPTKYSEMLSGMYLVDETKKKADATKRNKLEPVGDTQKVLEWGASHGLSTPVEDVLEEVKKLSSSDNQ